MLLDMTKEQQEKQSSAAAAESISSPRPSIPIGARVELRGLQAKPELNGRRGVVVKFVGSTGRYRVQLDGEGGGGLCAIHPAVPWRTHSNPSPHLWISK